MQLRMHWAHTAGWCGASSSWTWASSSSQGSSWTILHSACICTWVCPNPGAGLCIWCLGISGVSHEPTSQVCQGPSGRHHCPPAFWQCHQQTCIWHPQCHYPCWQQRCQKVLAPILMKNITCRCSQVEYWLVDHNSLSVVIQEVLSTDGWSTH